VQPAGKALKWLGDYLPDKKSIPGGNCGDLPYSSRLDNITCVSVEPDGNISLCKNFSIGNAGERSMYDIIQNYDPYKTPVMEAILQGGIAKLVGFALQNGILTDPEGYYSICDECTDLRHRLAEIRSG